MYNEFKNHEKSDQVKWIAAFVSIALLFVGVIAALIPAYSAPKTEEKVEVAMIKQTSAINEEDQTYMNEAKLAASTSNYVATRGVKLMSGAMTVGEGVLTQNVTATVLPTTATNNKVDWSFAWAEPDGAFESGKNVTDYVTVNPSADGSTTATINCLQAFPDATVIVTVTTRVGHFTATTAVNYIGIPSVMEIADNGEFDAQGRYAARAQSTTDFSIDLNNILGVVTDKYYGEYADFEIVSVEAVGSFVCSGKAFNSVVNMWIPISETRTINLKDIMNGRFSVSLDGATLKIVAGDPLESYSIMETIDGSGVGMTSTIKQFSYSEGVENCYFIVTVRDNYTGLTATANFYISCETNGVTVDPDHIIF